MSALGYSSSTDDSYGETSDTLGPVSSGVAPVSAAGMPAYAILPSGEKIPVAYGGQIQTANLLLSSLSEHPLLVGAGIGLLIYIVWLAATR